MKLLFTLIVFVTIIGTILCGTYQLDVDRDAAIKSNQPTNIKHHDGRGRGRCSRNTTPTVLPTTTRFSTLSSLLPFPSFTAPAQTPFPNIDIRDSEVLA